MRVDCGVIFRDLRAEDRYFGGGTANARCSHLHALRNMIIHALSLPCAGKGGRNLRLTQADVEPMWMMMCPRMFSGCLLRAAQLLPRPPLLACGDAGRRRRSRFAAGTGLKNDSPLELDTEDDGNLFDVEAPILAPEPKPPMTRAPL